MVERDRQKCEQPRLAEQLVPGEREVMGVAAEEGAGLVVTRKSGREKLHFLNAVPIRLIHDRWIDKYTERRVSALADLKALLEEETA